MADPSGRQAELHLPWPELVRRVHDDRPLRAAVVRTENRPAPPERSNLAGCAAFGIPEAQHLWVPNWPSTAVTYGIAGPWSWAMIVGRGGTTAVSDLPAVHGLAGTAGPQRTIKQRRDPHAAPRGHRITPPGQQTTTVLGGSSGICRTDPVTVPRLPIASDRHPGHHRAVTPGPGEATLDSAPMPSKRRPAHPPTGAAAVGAAIGYRELFLGLSTDPGRTCRLGYQIAASTV
jgi:hypothetical protein